MIAIVPAHSVSQTHRILSNVEDWYYCRPSSHVAVALPLLTLQSRLHCMASLPVKSHRMYGNVPHVAAFRSEGIHLRVQANAASAVLCRGGWAWVILCAWRVMIPSDSGMLASQGSFSRPTGVLYKGCL